MFLFLLIDFNKYSADWMGIMYMDENQGGLKCKRSHAWTATRKIERLNGKTKQHMCLWVLLSQWIYRDVKDVKSQISHDGDKQNHKYSFVWLQGKLFSD